MNEFTSREAYMAALAPLTGGGVARAWVDDWLRHELELVDDAAFAERFRAHYSKFDAPPSAYAHRIVRTGGCLLLGGIRFYGGDARRPFVDILAWRVGPDPADLAAAAGEAWSAFGPEAIRLLLPCGRAASEARIDQTVHAQRMDALPPPDGRAELAAVEDLGAACALVERRYADVRDADPLLAAEIFPAGRDELAECRDRGSLHFIMVDGTRAGLIATQPAPIACLRGHVIVEEVVATGFAGRGLATAAQCALAGLLRHGSPKELLLGTVQRRNHASRKSAERAGRPAILDYAFVDIRPRTTAS